MKIAARLIARNSADGTDFIRDDVPLGKTYWIDTRLIREETWGKLPTGKITRRETVTIFDGPKGLPTGWLPTELLDWKGRA